MTKLHCNCVYLIVKDIEKSIQFYSSLLESEVYKRYEDRWIEFKTPENFTIGLLSASYDVDKIAKTDGTSKHYDQAFVKNLQKKYTVGDTVVLNLRSDDLEKDYQRIKKLNPKSISEIQYVDYMFPYHFFIVKDPDGHVIEIADA